jgi:2-polyprenyl-6-methoxyphenol hydroxylase-like FAD-dependent oxidoreductase
METFIGRDLVDADIPRFPALSFSRIWQTETEANYGRLAWEQPAQIVALNWGGLYRNLRKRVPDDIYRIGHRVVSLTACDDNRVEVALADGSTPTFDLVVCADGYASLGRRTLFPEVDVAYAGYVLWRGFIPEDMLDESPPLEHGIRCIGYPGGHGIFYFVPGLDGSVASGRRLVNWGMYVPISEADITEFLTDRAGNRHEGSLPPGSMPLATERALKDAAHERLPHYYAAIAEMSPDTFAYAIYDCEVPAYRKGRICLTGDAGAFARPHSAAGALKGINDAVALGEALRTASDIDTALAAWNTERTAANNQLVRFGNQLGEALVRAIPDWSRMSVAEMEQWFNSIVTIKSDYIASRA